MATPVTLDKNASRTLLSQTRIGRGRNIFVDASASKQGDGLHWDSPKNTLASAIALAQANDVIILAPGAYAESVTIPAGKTGLTIKGLGGRGAAFIEPEEDDEHGLEVLADDVTLINVGVAGGSDADYALLVDDEVARFRAYGCKFEGPDAEAVHLIGCADILLDDCEFAWCGTGVGTAGGEESFPTQIFLKDCRFHNVADAHISDEGGHFTNLHVVDCIHDNGEDGTAPTKFLDIDDADSSGIITGCRFAVATNEADVIDIGAKILFVSNHTEAGPTTARPS